MLKFKAVAGSGGNTNNVTEGNTGPKPPVTSVSGSEECAPGWVGDGGWLVDGEPVNIGCLFFGDTEMTFRDAVDFCSKNASGTVLFEVHTSAQMLFVNNRMKKTGTANTWWGGAYDKLSEDQWDWRYSSEAVGAFVWDGGEQPPTNTSHNYLCFTQARNYYGWHCLDTEEHFPICQTTTLIGTTDKRRFFDGYDIQDTKPADEALNRIGW